MVVDGCSGPHRPPSSPHYPMISCSQVVEHGLAYTVCKYLGLCKGKGD